MKKVRLTQISEQISNVERFQRQAVITTGEAIMKKMF